ncbi:hypothetical protein [Psychromonas sp. SA13A]|uniref:hypothetical protein n=1 Tax=Psychromonas sp. SA13A TaxID=2686346 RepID=UPI00140C7B07|nr:hypothetical protein [Psychromonas sp. SA13A]
MHKFSTELVRNNGLIVVGNVSSTALANTNMAKSTLDAGRGGCEGDALYLLSRHKVFE